MDSSWLNELDRFLRGEENNLKGHKSFINYNYEYIDKSFPTVEAAHNVIAGPVQPTVKTPY